MVEGLSVPALTAGDSTPGWEHRLQALQGQILMQSGRVVEGRPLLTSAVNSLAQLEVADEGQLETWQALLRSE